LEVTEKDIFALCVKEEKYRKQLIDFDSSQSCPKGGDDVDEMVVYRVLSW
jgi:hypothetical protein